MHLAKLVLQDMVSRDSGKLLLTSSVVSMMPGPYQSIYNASKSFVQSFAEALQDELRDSGVTVTALLPGPVDTNFFNRSGQLDTLMGRIPKDDPAKVAKQGYQALQQGRGQIVASSLVSKLMGASNRVLPDSVKSAANRLIAKPLNRR